METGPCRGASPVPGTRSRVSGVQLRRVAGLWRARITYVVSPEEHPECSMEAKSILEDILNEHQGLDPKGELLPRVYLSDLSASSLDFKCMYWYHPPAYWDFMEMSEKVNLQILSRFNEAKIEFAFPTQKVHLVTTDHADESKS